MLSSLYDVNNEEKKILQELEDFLKQKAYIVTLKSEAEAAHKVYDRSSRLQNSFSKKDQISVGMASQFNTCIDPPLTAHEITVNILYYRYLRLK